MRNESVVRRRSVRIDLYGLSVALVRLFLMAFISLKVKGTENIKAGENYIFASNHLSAVDPYLMTWALKMQVHFLAKEELLQNPFVKWYLRRTGSIPIKRDSADIVGIKTALTYLKMNKSIGIFAEGKVNTHIRDNTETASNKYCLDNIKKGVAFLGIASGVAIVPLSIRGIEKLHQNGIKAIFNRPEVIISVGRPIEIDDSLKTKEGRTVLSSIVANKINDLMYI